MCHVSTSAPLREGVWNPISIRSGPDEIHGSFAGTSLSLTRVGFGSLQFPRRFLTPDRTAASHVGRVGLEDHLRLDPSTRPIVRRSSMPGLVTVGIEVTMAAPTEPITTEAALNAFLVNSGHAARRGVEAYLRLIEFAALASPLTTAALSPTLGAYVDTIRAIYKGLDEGPSR